ncbi:HK97 family phage prohead protease [Aquicoccus sp. SU-CL01552]|uniref:HK97 family phage prohead protease n=1 Tax=Aquicoccus sp. SU-CL01552 TaxID=3127656 RepID=UPI003105E533
MEIAKDMQRAHAVIQVKRADNEARRIAGIASTPTADRQGDILEPEGAEFKLPFPLLLGHDHTQPLGEITDARVTPQGIYIAAQIAPEGTTAKIDEAWRMIRAGLIKGLSVGFIGREAEPLPGGGLRFKKWEIIETSAVTVAANPEAGITEVKRLTDTRKAAPAPGSIPPYPRHLSADEQQAVREKAVRDHLDGIVKRTAAATGRSEAEVRKAHAAGYAEQMAEIVVHLRWQEERIKELETRHENE